MLLDFLIQKHECKHNSVPLDVDEAYCPDCGALVQNKWYLIRCSCCNIKRAGNFQYNELKPIKKFCQNCGSTEFYIQELDKIYCTDINYAIHKKTIIRQGNVTTRQIWIEKEEYQLAEKKLLEFRK